MFVLTNDFHHFVFTFPAGEALSDSIYAYNTFFWFVLSWQIFTGIFAVTMLMFKCRIPKSRKVLLTPLIPLAFAILYSILYASGFAPVRLYLGDMTVPLCIFFVAIFENCVRSGLIQANTHYGELFHASSIGAQIADEDFNILYFSENANEFDVQDLKNAMENPIVFRGDGLRLCLNESFANLRLYGAGCAYHCDDEADFDLTVTAEFYDFFETAVELSLDNLSFLVASVHHKNRAIRFSLMLCSESDMTVIKEKYSEAVVENEEGAWYISLCIGEEMPYEVQD